MVAGFEESILTQCQTILFTRKVTKKDPTPENIRIYLEEMHTLTMGITAYLAPFKKLVKMVPGRPFDDDTLNLKEAEKYFKEIVAFSKKTGLSPFRVNPK